MRAAAYVKVFLFLEPDPKELLLVAPEKVLLNSSDCDCGCAFDTRDLLKPRDLDSSCFLNMLMSVCLNDQTSVTISVAGRSSILYVSPVHEGGRPVLLMVPVCSPCLYGDVDLPCHTKPGRSPNGRRPKAER